MRIGLSVLGVTRTSTRAKPFPGSIPSFCATSGSVSVIVALTSMSSFAEEVVGDTTLWAAIRKLGITSTAAGSKERRMNMETNFILSLSTIHGLGPLLLVSNRAFLIGFGKIKATKEYQWLTTRTPTCW